MSENINPKIQFKRGTTTEWLNSETVLASGEPGYDTTTKEFKLGDGTKSWSTLENVVSGSGIKQIISMTQAQYDALSSPDPNILYVIS
jgi:hypothetical protein